MTAAFVDRVQAQAATVKPLQLLLTIFAAPFYVLGWLVGLVVVALAWAYAAVVMGYRDRRPKPDGA